RPCIADMGEVVDRRPAHIHAHARGIDRRKRPLLPCQRIVEPELHRSSSCASVADYARRRGRAVLVPAGPGVALSRWRKDGRSQRGALANNLAANAADMVKAVHHGRTMMRRADTVKACNAGTARVKRPLTILPAF